MRFPLSLALGAALGALSLAGNIAGAQSAPAQSAPAQSAPAQSAPAQSAPAQSAPAKVAPARLDSIARRIVAAARYATFVTVDSLGRPRVRTVQPRPPERDWSVWFATNPRTRKVAEVARRPSGAPVALHYFDSATESYVAITGRARVVRDRPTMDEHWDPAWNAFYADRDKGVALIGVDAERIEVVSPRLGVDSDPTTWRPQSFVPARRKP